MYIGLSNVQQLFPDSRNMLTQSEPACCLTGWIRLTDAPIPYTTRLLYVYDCNEILNAVHVIPNMHILCLMRESNHWEAFKDRLPASVNILFLENDNTEAVCAKLQDYFNTQCEISLFSEGLLDILSSEGGIQSMIDYSYRAFQNPIAVFDAGFNLVAANWDEAKKLNFGQDLMENKGFSEKEFKMANSRNHIHKRVQKSEAPIMAHNPEIGYDQLLCAIDTKKDLGHIVVSAVNRSLNPIDSQLLQVLKKCIDQQLKKDAFIRNMKGFHYESFLKDLLDGKIATGKSFLDRLDYVCRDFFGNMYCMVIETARSSGTVNTYHIRNSVESHFPNSKTLMYNGQIISILSMPEKQLLQKNHLNAAVKICKENELYAGLSNCFRNIIEICEYYKQALRAIELGICTADHPNLFSYEDHYLEHVKNIFVQKESSKTFCCPKMKILLNYDQKHNSELAYTLYMYLINERSIAMASVSMNMHRNSLVYRIKKINSLIGDDYESYRERQYLILSYELTNEDKRLHKK